MEREKERERQREREREREREIVGESHVRCLCGVRKARETDRLN